MNAKLMAFVSIMALAFCIFAITPLDDTDATEEVYIENLGSSFELGNSATVSHTFGGSGYWNDTLNSGPTVVKNNCEFVADTPVRSGSAYNWAWTFGGTITPTAAGSFTCQVMISTTGWVTNDQWAIRITGVAVDSQTYQYTIVYDANGGTGAPSNTSVVESTEPAWITLSSTEPTRSNYTFLGWSKSSTATSASYSAGGRGSFYSGTTTLYAVWQAQTTTYTHTLYYNANGGSGAPSTQTHNTTTNTSWSFTVSTTEPTRSNYTFLGWSTSSSASSPSYYGGSSISVNANSSKTLYAVWQYNQPSYTVYFDATTNGGTLNGGSSKTVTNGSTYGTLPTATKSTYTFLGWFTSSTGGTQITSSTTVSLSGNQTLYAQFTPNTPVAGAAFFATSSDVQGVPVNVIMDTNTTNGNSPNWYFVVDTTYTIYYCAPDISNPSLSRSDWIDDNFSWSTQASSDTFVKDNVTYHILLVTIETKGNVVQDRWISISSNNTYIAKFNFGINGSNNIKTINFMPNNGETDTTSVTLLRTDAIGTLPTATRTGYTFLGWFQYINGGTQYTPSSIVNDIPTRIYANWQDDNPPTIITVTASPIAGGGSVTITGGGQTDTSNTSSTPASITVPAGTSVTFSFTPNSGYVFSSWNYTVHDQYESTHTSNSSTFTVALDYDTTAVAYASATHTVSIVSNNTSYGTVSQSSIQMTTGSVYQSGNSLIFDGTSLPQQVVTATPSANTSQYTYTFVGWFDENDDPVTTQSSGQYVTSNTYTAKFMRSLNTYTVTFNVNDSNCGSVSSSQLLNVPYGTTITQTNNNLVFSGSDYTSQSVTATPNQPDLQYSYAFDSWTFNGTSSSVVQSDKTITANFTKTGQPKSVDIQYEYGVTIVCDGTTILDPGSTFNVRYGDEITITATLDPGFSFTKWTALNYDTHDTREWEVGDEELTVNGSVITLTTTVMGEETYYITVSSTMLTVSFVALPDYGSFDPVDSLVVPYGSVIHTSGNTITINGATITAIPDDPVGQITYYFDSWNVSNNQIITESMTITASFTMNEIYLPSVWWDNGYINGSATIVFDFSGRNASYGHQIVIPILKYDGIKNDADGISEFSRNGYIIGISMAYQGNIIMTLTDANNTVHTYPAFQIGEWTQYLLKLDVQNGYLEWGGIKSPYRNTNLDFNFTNYNTIVEKRIVDFSNDLNDAAFNRIYHEDTGTGTSHPHFQVVTTDTYLDTYGVVMNDPVINIIDQFPDYDDLRLNLYSFAVYGDSLNINGYTMNMNGSKVRVYYTMHHDPIYDDQTHTQIVGYDDYNEIATSSTPNVKYVDLVLSNVFITWENIKHPDAADRMCYLTFVDANMTFRMGSFQPDNLTISFDGIWYFTTALWEPYQAYEKDYSWDYHHPFNLDRNGFILIFIAISVAVFVIMNIYYRPSFLDYLVVIGAGIIAYVMLGGM